MLGLQGSVLGLGNAASTLLVGQLQTLGWSSICQVRKDRIERHISDEEQAESFERLLASIA